MKITFLGAAKTVTGSCTLIETETSRFIIDCGLFQGSASSKESELIMNDYDVRNVDFMILTHAHIDHSGKIPKLYADGYRNNIYSTKATAELCGIMLPDSGSIQESEAEWKNRKNLRAGRKLVKPLYTIQDAYDSLSLFKPVHYNEEFHPAENVKVVLRDAGHLLGSAIVELWVKEGGTEKKIVFSGDLGNKGKPIIRDPAIIDGADYLIVESTYGNRSHIDSENKVHNFLNILDETIKKGGNVIIPSFAIGRTQELIYELNKHKELYSAKVRSIFNTPVYIDSPLATSATKIFRQNPECYDEETLEYISVGDNPLEFPKLYFTRSVEDSKWLNADRSSKIIISASGMCDAGRIKHHLKHNLWRSESTILFVGYQAKGTLGRRLLDGEKKVRIYGEEISVNARIESIEAFSGHADREGILEWIEAMESKPEKIFLNHGESESIESLSRYIEELYGIDTYSPDMFETVIISWERESLVEEGICLKERGGPILDSLIQLEELQNEFEQVAELLKTQLESAETEEECMKLTEKIDEMRDYIDRLKAFTHTVDI